MTWLVGTGPFEPMNKILRRYPSTILRRAMTHLRKRYESSRSSAGREAIRQLKLAVVRVEQANLESTIAAQRELQTLKRKVR